MSFQAIADIIGKSAPLLGTALLGPAGGVVGALIGKALGVDAKDSNALMAAVSSPDAAVALKKLELEHEQSLNQIDLEFYQTQVADTTDARKRESSIVAALGHPDRMMSFLAILITLGFLVILGISYTIKLDRDLLITLGAALLTVVNYYFGSSHGERLNQKTKKQLEKEDDEAE